MPSPLNGTPVRIGEMFAGAVSEGRKTVAVPGTPEQITDEATPCFGVSITAETDNTGIIAVGLTNSVRATPGSQVGLVLLAAGQSVFVPVVDVSAIWLDASVAGDGVARSIIQPA